MSHRLVAGTALALLVLSTTSAQTQQSQSRDRKPLPSSPAAETTPTLEGTAVLGGVVTNNDPSPATLRAVQVVLIGTTTGIMRLATTDAEGHFTFAGLPADHYTIATSKLPYLGTIAGSRRPGRPGAPIALKDGESVTDVVIRMPRGASISGVVTTEDGAPAEGVLVGAKPVRTSGSAVAFSSQNGPVTYTDLQGRYRIHGLVPGAYAVMGLGRRRNSVTNGAPIVSDEAMDAILRGDVPPTLDRVPMMNQDTPIPVFYPGTVRVDRAQPIRLAEGQNQQGVDFRLASGRLAHVEGTVSSPNGIPPDRMSLSLSTVDGSSVLTTAFTTRVVNGRFEFTRVSPGSYILQGHTGDSPRMYATTLLDVDGFDQSAVQLTLRPALELTGQMTAASAVAPEVFTNRTVVFRALSPGADSNVGLSAADGSFSIANLLPGRYVVEAPRSLGASDDGRALGLQQVTLDGRDVTDRPIAIAQEENPGELVLRFSRQWQSISGRILRSDGAGITDFSVMVFPTDETLWVEGTRRVVVTQPGTDGFFRLGGPGAALLPVGNYYMVAVTDVTIDEQYDPLFLQSLIPSAITVPLTAGEQHTQDVRVR